MRQVSALLALVVLFFAGLALANTATLTTVNGTVQAQTGTAPARALRVGDLVRQGDTVITGAGSSAVLRFEDGQVAALTANSRMTITAYQYNPQTLSGNVLLSLIDGGMRAITGLIGNRTPSNVSYRAATATIGIRGTDITIVTSGGHVVVTVTSGIISFQRVNAVGQPIGNPVIVATGNAVAGLVTGQNVQSTAAGIIALLPAQIQNAVQSVLTTVTTTLATAITNATTGTATGITVAPSGNITVQTTPSGGGGTAASCTGQECTCPPPFVLNPGNVCLCPQGQVVSGGTCVTGSGPGLAAPRSGT